MSTRPNKRRFFRNDDDEHLSKPDPEAEEQQKAFDAGQQGMDVLVARSIDELQLWRDSLGESGSQETFTERARLFEELATTFMECRNDRHNDLFFYVGRSPTRRNDVDRAIKAARQAAAQFQRYAEGRKSYVQTDARLAFTQVITILRSLRSNS